MKKLLLIPTMFFPYSFVLGILISEPSSHEAFAAYLFWGFIALFFLFPVICNVIFMIVSRKSDPRELIRAALLIKLVHIPSYVIIFILGVGASLMFFMTFPLILMLVLFDYIVLLLSSMISVFALAKNLKNDTLSSVVALICQFVFCADVISLFVLQLISKKETQTASA